MIAQTRKRGTHGRSHKNMPCQEPKYFNDSPDECEMNKFDEMMDFISSALEGQSLRQVIAVDQECKIFSRAWVMAELIVAYNRELDQRLKMYDRASARGPAAQGSKPEGAKSM